MDLSKRETVQAVIDQFDAMVTQMESEAPRSRNAIALPPKRQSEGLVSYSGRYDMRRLKEMMLLQIANDGPLGPESLDQPLKGEWADRPMCTQALKSMPPG